MDENLYIDKELKDNLFNYKNLLFGFFIKLFNIIFKTILLNS